MRSLKFGTILMAALFSAGLFLATSAVAADIEATKALYMKRCAKCHGESGKGDGKKAKTLKKKPRDYTNKEEMAKLTDEDLVKSITEGKKPMPSFKKGRKKLTDEQINDLVAYIRTFAQ